jgi:hypothetical protein
VASGLMIENVRSIAIRSSFGELEKAAGNAGLITFA